MADPIGIIHGVDGVRRIRFRVFDGASVWIGQYVITSEGYLCRISRIERRNYLTDDRILAEMSSFERVERLKKYGFNLEFTSTITLAEALIIGVVEGSGIRQPMAPPHLYTYVNEVPGELISNLTVINGAPITIGKVKGSDTPAKLDAEKLTTHHCAILASTGSGKSWLAGVIAEELTLTIKMPVVIIDPHGEYSSMQYPAVDDPLANEVAGMVNVYVPGRVDTSEIDKYYAAKFGEPRRYTRIGVNPRNMPLGVLIKLLTHYYGLTDTQRRLLEEGWPYDPSIDAPLTTIDELIGEVIERSRGSAPKGYAGESSISSLISKLRSFLENRPFFITMYGEHYGDEPIRLLDVENMLSKPGINVIDLSTLDLMDQQALVALMLDSMFNLAKRRRIMPTFVVVEEAHNFSPSKALSISKSSILRIAREGRKFGLGLCIVSQRPSRIDPDVLSQCMTQVFKRIINPLDLKYVASVAENISSDELTTLKSLNPDEAYVTGMATPIPLLVKVKGRLTHHGGVTRWVTTINT
ncbi:ATP-binding protein [Caldivirga sp. UBA161]|uniref:ATP-binding protein n=1 Tax=Caldivirga sp. UBA161 TaxID=1915569 RepID=UPI0025B839DA|nr:ATP-binding protein [Caldivirga sp. UBA161]